MSLAGTSLAFGLYLLLRKRIGPARAAYTSVLFPVVALTVLVAGNALALGGRTRVT